MTITIKNVTMKNFLSIGNITQAIDFEQEGLTLVLGENRDLGGDSNGSRNGCGKTVVVQAISYAIYGTALNSIKKDNLINCINNVRGGSRIYRSRNLTFYKILKTGKIT